MDKIVYRQASSGLELRQAFAVRKKVFIEEQGIAESEEWDGLDDSALQFVAKSGHKVVGTARVRFLTTDCAKIERMAVLIPFRKKGIGTGILGGIEKLLQQKHVSRAVLHAQWTVVPFYQSCGFTKTGKPFSEADIKHIKMHKEI